MATRAAVFTDENGHEEKEKEESGVVAGERLSCNTCGVLTFDSLADQRSHFKSDFHRFNVKLTVAGKATVDEEDFDVRISDSLAQDYDISSISGSEEEDDRESNLRSDLNKGLLGSSKTKIFVHLASGEITSLWKCLFLDDTMKILFEHNKSITMSNDVFPCITEREMTEKLCNVICEPRDNTCFRVMLLASAGHFAGCVFDGNSVVAHKTFHRYVIRAKAGKKQSSKDASGKIAHSAGAALRRYNELSLKRDIRELLAAWKPYFMSSSCVFIHAPSDNRQLLFDGESPYFSCQKGAIRRIPLIVSRPTFKEAKRLYNILTQISIEQLEEVVPINKEDSIITHEDLPGSSKKNLGNSSNRKEIVEANLIDGLEDLFVSSDKDSMVVVLSTPLHEAAKAGNVEEVVELLEQGSDPCVVDERGRTPYMLATEKEVRNTFRRFMALNMDKWDWQVAKVPSPLTKEMEESQNAKQAEKDAKRKARAKELKKLRKAKEKKAEAEAAQSQKLTQSQSIRPQLSREEELKRAQDEEREKRAAAAERRIAALQSSTSGTSQPNIAASSDTVCSCCQVSLVGKVPFHRYNYKYCTTSCMRVHREILEDE
uniref:ankyrin repeat and zinc finger domain-containing protein 1-like isoform X2 n=1 Tax=Erigeron canadensis TaxID=72917 RepID=UPI001CB8BC77|nr:ankyrin repeat and zinc finger domain-containing protein 1-like isoform X2 [Erigeron canadensis]